MKPGPFYVFKLGLATALAFLACRAMGSLYPFYAVVSVIVVLQPTLGTTWLSSLRRIGGTLVGIPLGGLLATSHMPPALALGIGVATVVFVCTRLGLREGVPVSAFALASIVANHPDQPWVFAWHRLLDTVVGIGVAIAVNRLVFPPRAGAKLHNLLRPYLPDSAALLDLLIAAYLGETRYDRVLVDGLREKLRAVAIDGPPLWVEARAEGAHDRWTDVGSEFLLKRLREHLLAIDQAVSEADEDPFPCPCGAEIRQLAGLCSEAWRALARHEPVDGAELERASGALHEAVAGVKEMPVPALMRFFAVCYNLRTIESKLVQLSRPSA